MRLHKSKKNHTQSLKKAKVDSFKESTTMHRMMSMVTNTASMDMKLDAVENINSKFGSLREPILRTIRNYHDPMRFW